MPDFDVAALALASPPASVPPATYTPAISVRNNGIHDAHATGWLSFYRKSTGVLVAQFNVASGTIHPGATGNAAATGTLDLRAEPVGTQFIATGYVSCTNDQVEANNPLAPVIITVSAEPPPPPPPVAAHASQHEEGGGDTLSVEGLTGKLADQQEPTEHASTHELGGTDPITGIAPGAHAPTHSPEGGDPIDVTGMPGVLADDQPAATHDNDRHSTEYIDGYGATEIANGVVEGHNLDTTPHESATSLEHTANKGAASGYASLDSLKLVPIAQLPNDEPVPWFPSLIIVSENPAKLMRSGVQPLMSGYMARQIPTGLPCPPAQLLNAFNGSGPNHADSRCFAFRIDVLAQVHGTDGQAIILDVYTDGGVPRVHLEIPVPAGAEYDAGWVTLHSEVHFHAEPEAASGKCWSKSEAKLCPFVPNINAPARFYFDALWDPGHNWDPTTPTNFTVVCGVSGDANNYSVALGGEVELVIADFNSGPP